MLKSVLKLIVVIVLVFPISVSPQSKTKDNITTIAFGSCSDQNHPLPIFNVIASHKPDMFIFLGDNIYADTEDMKEFQKKYDQLAGKPSFINLKKTVPTILATWDDHDYGENDGGRSYKKKRQSKELFLTFFEEPEKSRRWKHTGIYTSYMYKVNGKKLQIILLDNRSFKEPGNENIFKVKNPRYFYELTFLPHNEHQNFLGAEQWAWLEDELSKDADIRIIGSGSQFGAEYNGYETWSNFPHEQQRLLDLIRKTKAEGVIFISGDVHYGEISRRNEPDLYPIYDMTASGMSSIAPYPAPNSHRVEGPVMENHFGKITIDWNAEDPDINMEIWDVFDNQRVEYKIKTSEISFGRFTKR